MVVYSEKGDEVARQTVAEGEGFSFSLDFGPYCFVATSGDAQCFDRRVAVPASHDVELKCSVQ